jgi:hypothetical protein
LTIEPGPTPAGRRSDGNSIRCTDWFERVSLVSLCVYTGKLGSGALASEMRTAMPAVDRLWGDEVSAVSLPRE